jgi:DNA-binding transcriptional ArsR family regulator
MNTLFKALNDPTRRKILKMLQGSDLTAGEIAENFDISKPSISHHLDVLKRANLIRGERDGQFIHYSINTTVLEEAANWFLDMVKKNEEDK